MLYFKKLTALVTLLMFASHGAMAAPLPQVPPYPEPILDSFLGNLGHLLGTAVGDVASGETTGQLIKGAVLQAGDSRSNETPGLLSKDAGGFQARQTPEPLPIDSLLANLGHLLGTL